MSTRTRFQYKADIYPQIAVKMFDDIVASRNSKEREADHSNPLLECPYRLARVDKVRADLDISSVVRDIV